MTAINEHYDNGTTNNGFLSCPCTDGAGISTLEGTAFTAWPNPFASTVNIAFTTTSDAGRIRS